MCYLPPAPALWMCLGALVGQGDLHRLQRRALVMGRQVTVCANPFLFREPCQPAGVLGLSESSANRNNGCSRGRPLRQADHRIQIALKSAPRAMGKTLVSAPSARIRLGRLATAVPNARRATCSASRRTEYDQLSMATGKAIGTAARLQYDLATRVTTSHHDDS
jgi:hypothetical protein